MSIALGLDDAQKAPQPKILQFYHAENHKSIAARQ